MHETSGCSLLMDAAEIQQAERSTDSNLKAKHYPKECIPNLITMRLRIDLKGTENLQRGTQFPLQKGIQVSSLVLNSPR